MWFRLKMQLLPQIQVRIVCGLDCGTLYQQCMFYYGTSPPHYSQQLQLLKARINNGDREARRVPEKQFNCLGSRNEINHKRIAEE